MARSALATEFGPGILPCSYSVTIIDPPIHPVWGEASVTPVDVNDSGVVVGYYTWLDAKAFRWTAEGGLETLTPPVPVAYARAFKVNNNGWIIVEAETSEHGQRSFVVTPEGAWIEMVPPENVGWTIARGINDDNVVVGSVTTGPPEKPMADWQCFVWSPGAPMQLIDVSPGPACGCEAINAGGTIVGWVGVGQYQPGAVGFIRLPDGETTLMPPIPGGLSSTAIAIDDLGLVVGHGRYTSSPLVVRAFVYVDGAMAYELAPPPGLTHSHANDIIPGGLVVGRVFGGGEQPSLWSPALGWKDIEELIDPALGLGVNAVGRCSRSGALAAKGSINVGGANYGRGLVLWPVRSPPDLSCDGAVGNDDLLALIDSWGVAGGPCDLNDDGVVDGGDLGLVLGAWGE